MSAAAALQDAAVAELAWELLRRAAAHWALQAAGAIALLIAAAAALGWPLWPRCSLNGRAVVVTGAAGGLGRELCLSFAREGARLVLWDVDEGGMAATAALLPTGAVLLTQRVDVGRRGDVRAAAAAAEDAAGTGGIRCVVNNAGLVGGRSLLMADDARIARVFDVNALSLFWSARAFLPQMVRRGEGTLVTIASGAGLVGVADNADYSASKHAAKGFNDSLRVELKKHGHKGVTTIGVYPGIIDTPLAKGYRLPFVAVLSPRYVAEQVVDAVRTRRSELYLPFTTLMGLYNSTLLPAAVFDWVGWAFGASHVADRWDPSHEDAVYAMLTRPRAE